MRKGQKQTEEAKQKIREARLKKDEFGYSIWNAKISLAMKKLWRKRKWEEKQKMD